MNSLEQFKEFTHRVRGQYLKVLAEKQQNSNFKFHVVTNDSACINFFSPNSKSIFKKTKQKHWEVESVPVPIVVLLGESPGQLDRWTSGQVDIIRQEAT